MTPRWAGVWDSALLIYGQRLPYHPRKWRVLAALAPLARPTWSRPRVAKRRGVWYQLDLQQFVDRYIYYLEYERWETRFVERNVRPGWVVVDVGAHIGYYSLLFSRLVGATGEVHAFEPAPSTYDGLKRNIELNKAWNVSPYRIGLADSTQETSLLPGKGGDSGRAHLAPSQEPGSNRVLVTTLDRFVNERALRRLDLIKVDIEGAEQRFLSGAEHTVRRFRPILMIEVNPTMLELFGTGAEKLIQALSHYGYVLREPTWRGLRPLGSLPAAGQYCNVVALPLST
jgi:FkbM family methyltransferase